MPVRISVGNDCIRIPRPRTIRYEKDISFHDYTSARSNGAGLAWIVIFSANIALRKTALGMAIVCASEASNTALHALKAPMPRGSRWSSRNGVLK